MRLLAPALCLAFAFAIVACGDGKDTPNRGGARQQSNSGTSSSAKSSQSTTSKEDFAIEFDMLLRGTLYDSEQKRRGHRQFRQGSRQYLHE